VIPGATVRQSDLAALRATYRLVGYPTVARVTRAQQGGGFGDQGRHPHAWAVFVLVDGLSRRVTSARGQGREWTSLDRLERWLRAQGFRYWWVSNELDPPGEPEG
jgi:predicted dehydrogenase